jgi:hypothetical protein
MLHRCVRTHIALKKQGQIGGRVMATAVVAMALLFTACAAPAAAPAAVESGAGAAAPETGDSVEIVLWVAIPDYAVSVLAEQLTQFETEHPEIHVVYENLSYDELLQKIAGVSQTGTPPDTIAVWSYGIQQLSAYLVGLEDWGIPEIDDFLPAALSSSAVDAQVFGLPWFGRQPCFPSYYSVGVSSGSRYPDAAVSLAQFLTRRDTQVNSYKLSNTDMLPTRKSAYEELGFECPPTGQLVVLPLDARQRAAAIADERVKNLQSILDKNSAALSENGLWEQTQRFSPERSTAVPRYEAYGDESEPDFVGMYIVATPVEINFSREAFDAALQLESGVIVGALFGVDEPLQLQFDLGGEYTISPNEDLAVKWKWLDSSAVAVYFVNAGGEEFEVGVTALRDLKGEQDIADSIPPGNPPLVTLELGSCYVCYYVDWYSGCATVSNASVSGFASYINRLGGGITYQACSR